MKSTKRSIVLVIEDDYAVGEEICASLMDRGMSCHHSANMIDAIKYLEDNAQRVKVALIDVMLLKEVITKKKRPRIEIKGGMELARHIKLTYPFIKLLGMSSRLDENTSKWFYEYGEGFLDKYWFLKGSEKEFIDAVEIVYRKRKKKRKPISFIVHGHDISAIDELLCFVNKELKWPRPIVLSELPSKGRTLIEKFELNAQKVDVVFALFTPDDRIKDSKQMRARQNVVFELGYFYAKLQRTSGRVLILYKGNVELPTDLAGIIYINISDGIQEAKEEILNELRSVYAP